MNIFLLHIPAFVLGTVVGSFLNVVIDRSISNEQFVSGRSYCDHCKRSLLKRDLFPILSFIFLGGKCRFCKTKLSYFYPTTEFVTGGLFLITSIYLYSTMTAPTSILYIAQILLFFLVSAFVVIFFADIKYGIIPLYAVITVLFISIVYNLLLSQTSIVNHFLTGLGTFAGFFLLFAATKGKGMGFGDVIYAFCMGFLLGYPQIVPSLYIAFLTGAIVSVGLIIFRKKKMKGSTIPFGPFLIAGTIIGLFWGNIIIDSILRYLLR